MKLPSTELNHWPIYGGSSGYSDTQLLFHFYYLSQYLPLENLGRNQGLAPRFSASPLPLCYGPFLLAMWVLSHRIQRRAASMSLMCHHSVHMEPFFFQITGNPSAPPPPPPPLLMKTSSEGYMENPLSLSHFPQL